MVVKKASKPLNILIVEDNADLAENIGDYLEARGHAVDFALDGIGGLHLALTQEYDVIVLDIMMPGMDGMSVCRKLREEGGKQTPIIMLTALDTLSDKLEGFDSGADDYLVKPFQLQELEARLAVLTKRSSLASTGRLSIADVTMDMGTMEVYRSGVPIELNRTCMKILTMLMQAYPNVVTRKNMEKALWGDMPPGSDALRSHIYALRRALEKPFNSTLIETIHRVGYRFKGSHDLQS